MWEDDQVGKQEQGSEARDADEWTHVVARVRIPYRRRLLLVTVDTDGSVQDLMGKAIDEFLDRYFPNNPNKQTGSYEHARDNDEDVVMIAARIRRSQHRRLFLAKVHARKSVQALAGRAVEEFLDRHYPLPPGTTRT